MPNRFIARMTDIAFHCSVAVGQFFRDLAIWQLPHGLQDGLQLGITSRSRGFVRVGLRELRKTACAAIFATRL